MAGNLLDVVNLYAFDPADLVAGSVGGAGRQWPSWQADAACLGIGAEDYFGRALSPEAAQRCAQCAVAGACLEYALAGDLFGWWAGTSERARRRLRKGITNPDPLCVAPGDGTQGGH